MGKFSRRQRARAWDEMSESDRAVLLEGVRQRREQQELERMLRAEQADHRMLR